VAFRRGILAARAPPPAANARAIIGGALAAGPRYYWTLDDDHVREAE
jgi:hypothetical protein